MRVLEIRSKRQRLLLAFKLELFFNKMEEVKNVSMCDDIEAGFLIASKMRFGSSRAELQQTL